MGFDDAIGEKVGVLTGDTVLSGVGLGDCTGEAVGRLVRFLCGAGVGGVLVTTEGRLVITFVGLPVGALDWGALEGLEVISEIGAVGAVVGLFVGARVGEEVGLRVGTEVGELDSK